MHWEWKERWHNRRMSVEDETGREDKAGKEPMTEGGRVADPGREMTSDISLVLDFL